MHTTIAMRRIPLCAPGLARRPRRVGWWRRLRQRCPVSSLLRSLLLSSSRSRLLFLLRGTLARPRLPRSDNSGGTRSSIFSCMPVRGSVYGSSPVFPIPNAFHLSHPDESGCIKTRRARWVGCSPAMPMATWVNCGTDATSYPGNGRAVKDQQVDDLSMDRGRPVACHQDWPGQLASVSNIGERAYRAGSGRSPR